MNERNQPETFWEWLAVVWALSVGIVFIGSLFLMVLLTAAVLGRVAEAILEFLL